MTNKVSVPLIIQIPLKLALTSLRKINTLKSISHQIVIKKANHSHKKIECYRQQEINGVFGFCVRKTLKGM